AIEDRGAGLGGALAQSIPIVLDLVPTTLAGDESVDRFRAVGRGGVGAEDAQTCPRGGEGGEDLRAVEGVAALAVRTRLTLRTEQDQIVAGLGDAEAEQFSGGRLTQDI